MKDILNVNKNGEILVELIGWYPKCTVWPFFQIIASDTGKELDECKSAERVVFEKVVDKSEKEEKIDENDLIIVLGEYFWNEMA